MTTSTLLKDKSEFQKLFYKIGEVSSLTQLEPYVLRYWEKEFHLKPMKSQKNQRLYQQKDIEQLMKIKHFLYDLGYTITGARKKLRQTKSNDRLEGVAEQLSLPYEHKNTSSEEIQQVLSDIRDEMVSMKNVLHFPV